MTPVEAQNVVAECAGLCPELNEVDRLWTQPALFSDITFQLLLDFRRRPRQERRDSGEDREGPLRVELVEAATVRR